MQLFQRVFALFSIAIVSGCLLGCGGPGTPVPGGSDPASEAADAALAPEGGAPATEEGEKDAAPAPEAGESAPADDAGAASAPESGGN